MAGRKKLSGVVFGDKSGQTLLRLQQIVWPEIHKLFQQRMKQLASEGKKVCLLEAAVLLEAGWDKSMQECWVVFVPREEAISRVIARDGRSREAVEEILRAQATNRDRITKADLVISTHGTIAERDEQVDKALSGLLSRAGVLSKL